MIATIKDYIIKNNKIECILELLDCNNIDSKCNSDWIYACYPNGDNRKGVCINKNTLAFTSMSGHGKGDIFTLTMQILKLDLYNSMKWLKFKLGIISDSKYIKREIFGGIYKKIKQNKSLEESKIYDMDLLLQYKDIGNIRFMKDNISLNTQLKYKIMYDVESDRIIIPYLNEDGLAGIVGRKNEDVLYDTQYKYLALLPYKKTNFLYGYYQNYQNLINNRIYIFEAEKSVMQSDTLGIFNCMATGHGGLSKKQRNLILGLNPTEVVICFDEGFDISNIKNVCNMFKRKNKLLNIKVGYIFDNSNKYMKKYQKQSPIECGNWDKLISEKIIWEE